MPHPVWSNKLGCFDRPYRGEKNHILLVGDSFTWGYAPFEAKFGTLLESKLNRRVLKCGVPGYGTGQELRKAKRVVRRTGRPSMIIVGYFENDLENDYVYPAFKVLNGNLVAHRKVRDYDTGEIAVVRRAVKKDLRTVRTFLDDHSGIYRLLKRNAAIRKMAAMITGLKIPPVSAGMAMRDPEDFPWLKKAWARHEKNLLGFKTYAESIDARLLIVIIPEMHQVRAGDGEGYYNTRLREFFGRNGMEYLDLLPAFRQADAPLYWSKDHHTNVAGNELIANEVYKYLAGL